MPGFSKTEEAAMDGFLELLEILKTTEREDMTDIYLTEAGKPEDHLTAKQQEDQGELFLEATIESKGQKFELKIPMSDLVSADGTPTPAFFQMRKMMDDAQRRVERKMWPTSKYTITNDELDYLVGILEAMEKEDHLLQPMVEYTFKMMSKLIHQNARDKGWYDNGRALPEEIALIHSEASEWLEEYRDGRGPEEHYYTFHEESGEEITSTKFFNEYRAGINDYLNKPEGQAAEAADVIIRVLDACGNPDRPIDISRGIWEKHQFNRTRPVRHGGKLA